MAIVPGIQVRFATYTDRYIGVVIEDAAAGVAAAKAAGMYCIAYRNPNSGNQDLSRADEIIEKIEDIRVI